MAQTWIQATVLTGLLQLILLLSIPLLPVHNGEADTGSKAMTRSASRTLLIWE